MIRDAWYWILGFRAAITCAIVGHDVVHTVDYNDGFDTYWCRRCAEGEV